MKPSITLPLSFLAFVRALRAEAIQDVKDFQYADDFVYYHARGELSAYSKIETELEKLFADDPATTTEEKEG